MSQSLLTEVAENICRKRYYRKDDDGNPTEDWEGAAHRIVDHVCKKEDDKFKKKIFNLIYNTQFLPNSPCIVNSGTNVGGLLACFVTKSPEDSWIGMMENLSNFGHIARRGGGCGVDFSLIRPEGDPVFGSTHAKACGPIEHMRVVSEAMSSITQAGFRGMANMGTLRVSHPDVMKFIVCKQRDRALKTLLKEDIFNHYDQLSENTHAHLDIVLDKFISNFNISVVATDEFMNKVKADEDFDLVFGDKVYATVKARDIFDAIVQNAWKNGDPGFLFYDRMNDAPYQWSKQEITATNPCFHGDTLVAVADGRNFVSIKQLAEEGKDVPLYSCDPETGAINIKWGRNPRFTRKNVKLVKVKFDDGGEIIVTPDHKIVLRNREHKKAQELQSGDSVMSMTKFNFVVGSCKYWGIGRGQGKSWKSEHRMVYEFFNDKIKTSSVIHHKDFNGENNDINNLEEMDHGEHSAYHRQFNNPMTHWYPNATEEERQRYHDNMSAATSGDKNGMYGRQHSKKSKNKIGSKTKERCQDTDYLKSFSEALKLGWNEDSKLKQSKNKKQDWKEGKYDVLKSPLVTKTCEHCGEEFTRKDFIAKRLRFCSQECGNQQDLSNEEIMDNACLFTEMNYHYPSASTWENFEDGICSRELIRTRFGNFCNLSDELIDNGVFANLPKNCKSSAKMVAGAIVRWTIDNGKEPSQVEMVNNICSQQTINRKGGYVSLTDLANSMCSEQCVNHKVVSVESLDITDDVYNITVDDYHNLCIWTSDSTTTKTADSRRHNIRKFRTIVAVNCGEQQLPPYGSCNLGSIAVSKFYDEETKEIAWTKLRNAIHTSVQFLDDVIEINQFPTDEFAKWAKQNRPVGLGVMGWADLLLKMKIAYGSPKSIKLGKELAEFFEKEAHKKSVQLGKERGTPKYCRHDELGHRRNVTTISIAPTGSISLIAGCSSSIEPIYSPIVFMYNNTGSYEMPHIEADKSYFRCALDKDNPEREVTWKQHIDMQAAFQAHCDSGISKTINMPNDATIKDVEEAYMRAWKSGCKGVTIYRDGSKTTQVLNTSDKDSFKVGFAKSFDRPKEVLASIHKVKAEGLEWHIIVGDFDRHVPYEIFAVNGRVDLPEKGVVVKRKKRHYSLLDLERNVLIDNLAEEEKKIHPKISCETRRFSLELRHGIPPKYICQQIDKSNESLHSFSKAANRVLKKYLSDEECLEIAEDIVCPSCADNGQTVAMVSEAGCLRCQICSYSKCG